ncbi:MAG TPA: hypothetical protein VES20_25210 [Bryobacteraceae bacterium]|nr:hypothetical protein [Bryobacteraceae bacterium]
MNRVQVNRRAAERIASGHPWIYASDVAEVGGAAGGDAVLVQDDRSRTLGTFHYSSSSQIALRQLSATAEPIDARLFERRLSEALA